MKQGLWLYYYENGKKRLEINFKDDKYEGAWTEWYENGQIAEQGEYLNGEYFVRNFWDETGNHLLVEGTGKTIRVFGASDEDIYEQYFENGNFLHERKISGVVYGKFSPNGD